MKGKFSRFFLIPKSISLHIFHNIFLPIFLMFRRILPYFPQIFSYSFIFSSYFFMKVFLKENVRHDVCRFLCGKGAELIANFRFTPAVKFLRSPLKTWNMSIWSGSDGTNFSSRFQVPWQLCDVYIRHTYICMYDFFVHDILRPFRSIYLKLSKVELIIK